MNPRQFRFITVFAVLGAVTWAQDDIEYKRISISGQFDNGQIVSGHTNDYDLGATKDVKLKGDFFTRTGVWITQEAVIRQRLTLTMGVGGIFWYSLPINRTNVQTSQTQFGPGISQAQGTYVFGDLENPTAALQMGLFPYKYNPDAKNLGEYLLRSGTYPGYLVTGGWNMLNSAGYMVQGIRAGTSFWDNKANVDLVFAMEHDLPPLFSVTPALIGTVKPIPGLHLGAGVALNHFLSTKPSKESPHVLDNQIITGVTIDTGTGADYTYTYTRDTSSYYTFRGVKVSANASIDPKAYLPMSFLGPEDLKLYGEIAVLGWKNYSYLYEKRTERMPVMVGFNIPTFKLLDVLSIEGEYYNNQFVNNYRSLVYGSVPIWNLPGFDGSPVPVATYKAEQNNIKQDNWKWSLYGKKEVTKGISLYGQVASDHIRTITTENGPFPAFVPVTNRNGKEWYYIIRLDFGI